VNEHLVDGINDELERLAGIYAERGFAGRVGYGSRPALLVVDLIRGFTDPASDLGGDLDAELAATRQLVDACHDVGAPVIFSTVSYDPALAEAGVWADKIESSSWLVTGTPWVEVDERSGRRAEDMILVKKYASCFTGTDLISRLVSRGVDTLLIAGATTSGCVRASAVDACSYGFRTIVVREAVGDRALLPHLVNLFDIDMKYGDVVSLSSALDFVSSVSRATAAAD
jgi:nicotinamidase-related amidase